MKPFILSLFAVGCAMFSTGCFTAMTKMMSGMGAGTGGSSAGSRAATTALDVVTMPIQAPFLAAGAASHANHKASRNSVEFIRKSPERIFHYRADMSGSTVLKAIQDPSIPFTESQFRRLAAKGEWTRVFVVANPKCPLPVLESVWQGLSTIPAGDRPHLAYSLAKNPNVPEAWLEAIAREALEKRRPQPAPR